MFYNVRNEIIFIFDLKKEKMFFKDNFICLKLFVNVLVNINVLKKFIIFIVGGVLLVLEVIINILKGKIVYFKY